DAAQKLRVGVHVDLGQQALDVGRRKRHAIANDSLLWLRMANGRRRPAIAVAIPRRNPTAPSSPHPSKWSENRLGRSGIAMRANVHPLKLGGELPTTMKRLVVLRKREDRSARAIGIIVAAIRHAKLGNFPFRRQVGQLHHQLIAPPLLERLLLLLQLILS